MEMERSPLRQTDREVKVVCDYAGARAVPKRGRRRYCCVVNCHEHEGSNPEVHFYRFPGKPYEVERRERWIRAVRRVNPDGTPWLPTANTRICSRHFVGNKKNEAMGHPAYVPTIFPAAYSRSLPADPSTGPERFARWKKRGQETSLLQVQPSSKGPNSGTAADIDSQVSRHIAEAQAEDPPGTEESSVVAEDKELPIPCPEPSKDIISAGTQLTDSSAQTEQPHVWTTAAGPSSRTCFFGGYSSIIGSPGALCSLCGVGANVFALLLSLLPTVRDRTTDVTLENKLLMFLMKMKLGISFSAISVIFGTHKSTANRVFFSVLHTLAEVTRNWIYKPPIGDIKMAQPASFRKSYPECTLIIDCTEIKTETPSEVRQQHMLFSSYKGCYTLKFLVGIMPNGMVVFASKLFGGRCSDTHITLESGFLNIVEEGDMILADKGFPGIRTHLASKGVVMVMPPFSVGGNIPFTPEEMEETYRIASVRVHVERAIQRIKLYGILKHVPISLIPAMQDIFHMCCVLANLQHPIINS